MKKYFCVETDEPVNFGDVLHLTFCKDVENGKVTVEKEITFTEDTLDWMIEMGFVKERDAEDEDNDLLDFGNPCEELQALVEDFEALEKRVEELERKTASPKKK